MKRYLIATVAVFAFAITADAQTCKKLLENETCEGWNLGEDLGCPETECEGEFPNVPVCPLGTNETRQNGSEEIDIVVPADPGDSGFFVYNYTGAKVDCGEKRACHSDCNLATGVCKEDETKSWGPHITYTQPIGATGQECNVPE